MNQNTPQTPLQAGLAAVAAMDATSERLEAIARVLCPPDKWDAPILWGTFTTFGELAMDRAGDIIVSDPATQKILDLQEKVRALTLVADNAKALAKGAAQMRHVLEGVRPLVRRAILDDHKREFDEMWLEVIDKVLADTAPRHTP